MKPVAARSRRSPALRSRARIRLSEATRTAIAESNALTTAKIVAESVASGEPALSVERALDSLHAELSKDQEPILERLEREMITRVLQRSGGKSGASFRKTRDYVARRFASVRRIAVSHRFREDL